MNAGDEKAIANARTGAITITYTSPEELPFKFSWTATVDVNGNVKYAIDLMLQSQNPGYDLEIRDDGTATLTFTYSSPFGMGVEPNLMAVFGKGTMKCALSLDLNGDRAVVTDAKLAQSFEA